MPSSWKPILLASTGVLLLAGALLVLTPSPADAQCGSQASSCKNCHEVQAQDPVNSEGDWHVSHAFGDFCEFCHAGNVQAPEADLAHQGMVAPLADPAASCSACHPADARDLAVVYGATLGIEVGAGGGQAPAASPTDSPTTAAPADTSGVSSEPAAAEMIDYNALYAETVEGRRPISTGNLILGILIAALVLGGGGYVAWNERRRRVRPASTLEASLPMPEATTPPEEPGSLLEAIAALDPLGRRALEQLLHDPANASAFLKRWARLDPELIRTLRGLDRETRALLLALTSD
jgi:hypothetical protein